MWTTLTAHEETEESRTCFLIGQQVFRPEYCQSPRSEFDFDRSTPNRACLDDLVEIWSGLRQETKERVMLTLHLQLAKEFDGEAYEHKKFLADMLWILRCCLAGETDQNKLRWHFEHLWRFWALKEQSWELEIGVFSLFNSYTYGGDRQFVYVASKIFAAFRNGYCSVLGLTRLLWEFRQFATDIDRFNRKLGACRITLTSWDCRLIEQFAEGKIVDHYLKGLKAVYGSAWRHMAIGPLRTCKFCGVAKLQLYTCGLCVQEHIRKKTRYCSKTCQLDDWPEHRGCHASSFDFDITYNCFRDNIVLFNSLVERMKELLSF